MTIDDRLEHILSTLDLLLYAGHVEAARLLISELRHRRLEDPGVDALTAIDDETFEDLSKRIHEEAFRRERTRSASLGEPSIH